jgi:hypothetical protein
MTIPSWIWVALPAISCRLDAWDMHVYVFPEDPERSVSTTLIQALLRRYFVNADLVNFQLLPWPWKGMRKEFCRREAEAGFLKMLGTKFIPSELAHQNPVMSGMQ